MNLEKVKRRFLVTPWIILPLLMLGYIGYQELHLLELLIWQVGAIAIAPFLGLLLDAWLFPDSSPSKLKEQGHKASDWVIVIAQLRRTAIVIAIIVAIAVGV